MSITTAGFIVVQGETVCGSGWTAEAAREDAKKWVDDPSNIMDAPFLNQLSEQQDADIKGIVYLAPASAEIVGALVEARTPLSWDNVDGTFCTKEESGRDV